MADFQLTVALTANPSVDSFKAEITKMVSDLNSGIPKIKIEFDSASINTMRSQIESLYKTLGSGGSAVVDTSSVRGVAADAEKAAAAVRNYTQAQKESENASKTGTMIGQKQRKVIDDYYAALMRAQKALDNWSAAERSKNDSSRAAYKELSDAVAAVERAHDAYDGTTKSAEGLKAAIEDLNSTYKRAGQTIAENGDNTKSLAERFGNLAGKFSAWLTVSRLVMYAVRAIREMISASIEIDTAMTQMQIVTKASSAEMEAFGNAAAQSAQRTASSIKDIVDSATTFARLGYSMEDSRILAEYTTMLQNVGNIDVSSAQSSITSIIKAFDIDTSQIESVMDKLVVVGNNFPISVSEIAEGMTNASSTLQAAGNSFEQTVALLTAANVTIQNAAKSSTGLRTITARIRNTTTELDELGEVMTEAKYEELISSITKAGVSITDMNGEFRSTYDILADLSAIWSELDSKEQAAIATALAGTRMQAVFYSIVNNFKEASGAMDAMKDSAGELDSSFGIYLDSVQAHINQFKAAFQELSSDVFKSGILNFFIDIGTGIIKFIDILAKLTPVFTPIYKLQTLVSHIGDSGNQLVNLRQEFTKITESIQSTSDDFNSLSNSFESVIPRFIELSRGVDELGGNVSLTSEDYAEFLELNNKIAEMFPQLVTGYDENGNAMLSLSYSAETLTASLNDLLEAERELSRQKMAGDLEDVFKNINKQNKLYDSELDQVYEEISNLQLAYEDFKNAVGDGNTYDYRWVGGIANSLYEAIGYTGARFIDDIMMEFDTDAVERAYENTIAGLWKKFDSITSKIVANDKKLNPYIQAWLSTDYNYGELSASMQTLVKNMLSGLHFMDLGLDTVDEVKDYIYDNIISPIQSMAPEVQEAFSELLTIRTTGKSGFEYIQEVNDVATSIAESIGYTWNPQEILRFTLHDKTVSQIESTAKEIASVLAGGFEGEFQSIYDEMLSIPVDQLYKAITLVKKYGITSIEELRRSLTEKTFDSPFDFAKESESFTKLNTALNESASATGLTADSIAELTNRYSELDGFDPATLFEHTANGVHLNANALQELEAQYDAVNKAAAQSKLETLIKKYQELTEAINNETDAQKRNELYVQRDAIVEEINNTKNLISYYNGLTSAYNRWIKAKNTPDQRTGYANVGEGYTQVKDIIDHGWVNDSEVNEYLDLLLEADQRTNDNAADFQKLTEIIDGTDFSIMDFFQYDKDNKLTTNGLLNFLKAVHDLLGDDYVSMGQNGIAEGWDFAGDKINNVAKALGISVEMIQLFERALSEAGFDVIFDSTFSDVDAVISKSEKATDKLRKLQKEGKIKADFLNFNTASTNLDDITSQIDKAKTLVDKFKDKSGKINFKLQGAKEAATILAALYYRKVQLEYPTVMNITVSEKDAETDAGKAILLMQKFLNANANLQIQTTLGDPTEAQKEVDAVLAEISENETITATLGIDPTSQATALEGIKNLKPEILATLKFGDGDGTGDEGDSGTDGNLNVSVTGAEEAGATLDNLNAKRSEWMAPAIMHATVSAEDAETDAGKAFKLLQAFLTAYGDLEIASALGYDTKEEQRRVDDLLAEISQNSILTSQLGIDPTSSTAVIESVRNIHPQMLANLGLSPETVKSVEEYKPDPKSADVIFTTNHFAVDQYIASVKDIYRTIWYTYKETNSPPSGNTSSGSSGTGSSGSSSGSFSGGGGGHPFTDGTAYATGNWGTKDSGVALGGELGQELVIRNGNFFTIGDDSAELFRYQKGDIIFNADQTREIFKYGRIVSKRRRGSALVWGTAFDSGSAPGGVGMYDGDTHSPADSSESGSSGGGKKKKKKKSKDDDNWFTRQYKLYNHLLKMGQEDTIDYLKWLQVAYEEAYREGLITLDEYRQYQEEIFSGLQDAFNDYLSDIEHQIDMHSNYFGQDNTIITLYQKMMGDIEKEIAAAREHGLNDNDDYIQQLQSKYQQYASAIKDLEKEINDGAQDAVDQLVEYRIKMLKQSISDEKDALKKQLDNLKDFYDKQKEMLKDARDEEKYLDEQAEKRKSVTDIQAQLAQLEYDNSAWAQKRKAELRKQLADAEKELENFEKDHALDETLDFLDSSYEAQEAQINAEMDKLDDLLNDPEALYNKALADVVNNTDALYQEMLQYNRKHGTGNDADIDSMYGDMYEALLRYHELTGEWFGGVELPNYTGRNPHNGTWQDSSISDPDHATDDKVPPDDTKTHPYGKVSKSEKELKIGDNGDEVKALQFALNELGYGDKKTKKVNGEFDKNTEKALKKFQKALNIDATGIVDAPTKKWFGVVGYASGTRRATSGLHSIDELGPEYIFTLADGNRYRLFSGGEKVLDANATNFLYEFAHNGKTLLSAIMSKVSESGSFRNIQPLMSNSDIKMGDIIVQGNADKATVSEIRRAQREQLTNMLREFNRLNK